MKYLLITVMALLAGSAQGAQFRGIRATDIWSPGIGVTTVNVTTISGDGSTLGGTMNLTGVIFDCATNYCGTEGLVWSHEDAIRRNLGFLSISGGPSASPLGVGALSFDGSKALVSYAYSRIEAALHHNGSAVPFREPTTGSESLWAADMTPNASVVVGSLGTEPFRWSQAGGFEEFGGIAPDSSYGPLAISNDGSTTLLGPIANGPIVIADEPFVPGASMTRNTIRWTAAEGPIELGPAEGFTAGAARALSADGRVIAGHSSDFGVFPTPRIRATVWQGDQPTLLPAIADYCDALDISADGSIIVGTAGYGSGVILAPGELNGAVIWKDGTARFITELLTTDYGLGVELEGWHLTYATAISDDGTVIAGNGFAPDGSSAAWVVVLAVPEPASVVLALVGVMAVMAFRMKK
jgi:uncharacterized membrane protein